VLYHEVEVIALLQDMRALRSSLQMCKLYARDRSAGRVTPASIDAGEQRTHGLWL